MPNETESASERRKLPIKPILVLLGIMLLEGGLFSLWIIFSGPKQASGESLAPLADRPVQRNQEIKILEFRATNMKTGRTVHYDIEVAIECERDKVAIVEEACKKRDAYIRDALATIIRRADPQHMQEPDLETLRRQINATLTEVFGEGVILKVLIPRCVAFRADY